ncbi:MAG: flagellar basal body P-ring formation protein FlgA [Tabrizicola sp.]|nr:flagellar basal body P-ring formation protein FlgA [Tabrizicola sp.]
MWRVMAMILLAQPAFAESVVALRTIRAQTVIGAEDLTSVDAEITGALIDPGEAIGLEARVAIYAGKPVRPSDLGPPALVERNQIIPLIYLSGGLAIKAEGRALARGGEGDVIRVMNLGSRTTVSGRVASDGAIYVGLEQ